MTSQIFFVYSQNMPNIRIDLFFCVGSENPPVENQIKF